MGNSGHIGYFCQILSFLILDQDPVWQVLFHLSYDKPGWCGSQDKDYSAKNQPSIMSRTFFSGQLTSVLGLNTKLGTTSKKETEQNIVNFFCVTKKNLRGANAGCLRPFTTRARVRTRLWSLGGVQKSSASEGFIGRKNFWQSETKASARAHLKSYVHRKRRVSGRIQSDPRWVVHAVLSECARSAGTDCAATRAPFQKILSGLVGFLRWTNQRREKEAKSFWSGENFQVPTNRTIRWKLLENEKLS